MVLVGAFLLAGIAVYRDRQAGSEASDTFRALWGVGVVSLVLSLVADFVPQIAGPFAGLAVLGSLTNGGDQILQNMLGKVAPPPVGAASTAPAKPVRSGPTPLPGGD